MKKILIIEDDLAIRTILTEMLEDAGYQAITAANGRDGIHLAHLHDPDLVVCDILMPELDGYGVLASLRQHPATNLMPLIFLTAKTDRTDMRQGMVMGADDYLTKPFTREELLLSIATRLQRQAELTQALSHPARQVSASDLALEAELRQVLQRSELILHYQPRVDLSSGQIIGSEALVRWQHPRWGWMTPAAFIPLAEVTGLVLDLDEWVLKVACQQTQCWRKLPGCASLQVSVNLSGVQLIRPNLCQWIEQILAQAGLPPQFLELELTESTMVQDVEKAKTHFTQLKAIGIKIAIDDFGTGYASLGCLQRLPFDTLKIDKCFIQNLPNDTKNAAIVTAMIQMAHSLNLKTVAEGVEAEPEQKFLVLHHCDQMQGYLFSRPLPALEFEKLLLSQRP